MTKASCEVLILFGDESTRAAAVQFCDELVRSFWARAPLEVSWYNFEELADQSTMNVAASKAIGADLLVFSLRPFGDLPEGVKTWTKLWKANRGEREGAIVGLGDPAGVGGIPGASFTWLRQLAHHAGLDYLTKAPPGKLIAFPEQPEPYCDRANQRSAILEGILLQRRNPPGSIV